MSDYAHLQTDKMLAELEARISREYRTASDDVARKLNEYLEKFKEKDAEKLQLLQDGKITKSEYDKWRTGQIMTGKRWADLADNLATDYTNSNKIAAKLIGEHLPDVYALNHNYSTYQIEKTAKANTNYTLYDKLTVENLLKNDPELLPKPKINIPADKRWNKQLLNSNMLQSILQGESIPKIAKRVARATGESSMVSAVRNARTMTTGAENKGRLDSYERAESMGIKLKQKWIATLDGRTRHSHAMMDGESRAVGETFSNGCEYPGDPKGDPSEVYNCRCTLIAEVEGFEKDASDLSLRHVKNFEYKSYDEWKNAHIRE